MSRANPSPESQAVSMGTPLWHCGHSEAGQMFHCIVVRRSIPSLPGTRTASAAVAATVPPRASIARTQALVAEPALITSSTTTTRAPSTTERSGSGTSYCGGAV